jgi:hypothetical protein
VGQKRVINHCSHVFLLCFGLFGGGNVRYLYYSSPALLLAFLVVLLEDAPDVPDGIVAVLLHHQRRSFGEVDSHIFAVCSVSIGESPVLVLDLFTHELSVYFIQLVQSLSGPLAFDVDAAL